LARAPDLAEADHRGVLFQQHPSKIKSLGLWEGVVLHCPEGSLG
jgi:hypothetical protein